MKFMFTLYTKAILEQIRSNLENGIIKFKINEYNMIFSPTNTYPDTLIQRVSNFALGLGYNIKTKEFYFNYPHISNVNDDDLRSMNGIIEEKKNGSNLGFIKTKEGLFYRTRGSINPDKVVNGVNTAILTGQNTIQGIPENIFKDFSEKYKPMLMKGIDNGYVDSYGNFLLEKLINDIKPQMEKIIRPDNSIIGIFGEIVSKYNTIPVDPNISAGIYINMDEDYMYYVFDIMVEDPEGNIIFEHPNTIYNTIIESSSVKLIHYKDLKNLTTMIDEYGAEEGLVVKNSNGYFKLKREDVITWERMMGKLTNVIYFATEHIFTQIGFQHDQIIKEKIFLKPNAISEIIVSIWQEIKGQGISKNDLLDYFKSKKMDESALDRTVENAVMGNLLIIVASYLKTDNIPKERLYLELPKYLYFGYKTFQFDDRRKKDLPTERYAKQISRVIGKTYLNR